MPQFKLLACTFGPRNLRTTRIYFELAQHEKLMRNQDEFSTFEGFWTLLTVFISGNKSVLNQFTTKCLNTVRPGKIIKNHLTVFKKLVENLFMTLLFPYY